MDFDDIVKIVDQVKVLEARLAAAEAERDAARAEGEKLRRLLDGYIALAISVRDKNTPEWMGGFVEDTNRTLEAIGDDDRVLLWGGNIYVKRLTNKGRQ